MLLNVVDTCGVVDLIGFAAMFESGGNDCSRCRA